MEPPPPEKSDSPKMQMPPLEPDSNFDHMVKSQDIARQKVDGFADVEDEFEKMFGEGADDEMEQPMYDPEPMEGEDDPDLPKFGDDLNASFGRNESDPVDEPENAQGQEDRIMPQELRQSLP